MSKIRVKFKVKFERIHSEVFEVKVGLKLGDALSPTLFNLALECMVRKVTETAKRRFGREHVLLA